MVLSEKLEKLSPNAVHFHKEGVFWVCYEEDAYRVFQTKCFRPTKKQVKSVWREVVSVGFPDSSLEGVLSVFPVQERDALHVCATAPESVDQEAFAAWKSGLPLAAPSGGKPAAAPSGEVKCGSIIDRIRSFNIENKTPLECVLFVSKLKELTSSENLSGHAV